MDEQPDYLHYVPKEVLKNNPEAYIILFLNFFAHKSHCRWHIFYCFHYFFWILFLNIFWNIEACKKIGKIDGMGIPDEVLITNPELVIELAEKDLDFGILH